MIHNLYNILELCPKPCTKIRLPVCGTDEVTYGNICELENAACLSPDKNIKKRSQGECDQGKGPKHLLHCRQCKTKKEGVEFRRCFNGIPISLKELLC